MELREAKTMLLHSQVERKLDRCVPGDGDMLGSERVVIMANVWCGESARSLPPPRRPPLPLVAADTQTILLRPGTSAHCYCPLDT
jgi:hypothetical protein